jgi:hypothetical protein
MRLLKAEFAPFPRQRVRAISNVRSGRLLYQLPGESFI